MKTFSMSEVINQTGISKDTIRFYEKSGIINQPNRDSHGYRCFSPDDIQWLKIIRMLREWGVPVKDLKAVPKSTYAERRAYLTHYISVVDEQIAKLEQIKQNLKIKVDILCQIESNNNEHK